MPLTPWLNVRSSAQSVDFYKAAFAATELLRHNTPDGTIAHLAVAGSSFWLSEEESQHANFSPQTLNGSSVRLILEVDDVDATFAKAISAGAKSLCPVKEDNGWLVGRVADPYGHQWEIARKL